MFLNAKHGIGGVENAIFVNGSATLEEWAETVTLISGGIAHGELADRLLKIEIKHIAAEAPSNLVANLDGKNRLAEVGIGKEATNIAFVPNIMPKVLTASTLRAVWGCVIRFAARTMGSRLSIVETVDKTFIVPTAIRFR